MVPVTLRGSRAALTLAAIVALASLVVTGGAAAQQGATWSFDDQPAGRPPPAFVFAGSPRDQVGQWIIVREGSNGVLAQVQQGRPGARLAVVEGTSFADLILSTRIRFAEGAGSAGLVWRYRDADNYYLAVLDLRTQAGVVAHECREGCDCTYCRCVREATSRGGVDDASKSSGSDPEALGAVSVGAHRREVC